jgi:hypothetical protein
VNGSGVSAEDARRVVIKDGTLCGALAAAVAVLYFIKENEAAVDCQDELMTWFNSSFGGYDCETVSANPEFSREELCPKLLLATYLRQRSYTDPDNHRSQKTLI